MNMIHRDEKYTCSNHPWITALWLSDLLARIKYVCKMPMWNRRVTFTWLLLIMSMEHAAYEWCHRGRIYIHTLQVCSAYEWQVHSLCLAQNLTCSVKYVRTVYTVLNSTSESMPAADTCNKGENVHTLQQAKWFSTSVPIRSTIRTLVTPLCSSQAPNLNHVDKVQPLDCHPWQWQMFPCQPDNLLLLPSRDWTLASANYAPKVDLIQN